MPKTESGNMYILVVGDYLTKWKEAFAIPYHEAKTMALIMKLANEAISRYGASEQNPFRPGTRLRSPAVPGNVCAVQHGQEQNLSIPPKK